MARLVNDMLQLANADSHSWSMHPAEVELDTLLLEVFESFESQAMAHQLRWDIRLPSEAIPPCLCDEERIRQLLSIARAAAANPRMLLLDEITANLDAKTEAAVLDALERVANHRTVISISHRTSARLGRVIQIEAN